jgi:hypothetical protein
MRITGRDASGSREVGFGGMFVAVAGGRVGGHDFVVTEIRREAGDSVAEALLRLHRPPSRRATSCSGMAMTVPTGGPRRLQNSIWLGALKQGQLPVPAPPGRMGSVIHLRRCSCSRRAPRSRAVLG